MTAPDAGRPERVESGGQAAAEIDGVTVVVCNFNGEEHLGPCLEAILAQAFAPDEVLVVDNASTDGSVELVRTRYPHVRLLELPENAGPCPARNAGLRAARNAWVLLVDNDAVLRPDVLQKLVDAARLRPESCLLQPRSVLADDPATVHYDGGRLHYAGLFSLRNFYVPLVQSEGVGTVEVDGVVSVVLLCDRKRVLRAGGFDEDYFILFEDLDLSLRLRTAGEVLLSVEDAVVLHRSGTPGISFRSGRDYPARRAFFHSRNRWLTLVKNYRWRTLFVVLPGLAAYEFVWLAFTLRSGGFWAHLHGKWAFLRLLPSALEKRAQVQAARRLPDRALLVGGPLTISPHLAQRPFGRSCLRLLDRVLSLWWRLVRPLAG